MHDTQFLPHQRCRRPRVIIIALFLTSVLIVGCGQQDADRSASVQVPEFEDPRLVEGRSIWMGTCRACHLMGVAGAPAITDYASWEPRLVKGMAALYQGPIQGIKGEDGKYRMPPRAGNDRLSDYQIERAVDYMVAAVEEIRARQN